jgi:hypothetical protein
MGLFKQIKNLRSSSEQAAADDVPGSDASLERASDGADFDPIAGVSLELYAEIFRHLADADDASQVVVLAAAKGVSVADWEAATKGWSARIMANPAVGRKFSALYQASGPLNP